MSFLDKMINDLKGSREFNQNAGLAATAAPQGYTVDGLTDREANELAQRQAITERAAVRDRLLRDAAVKDAAQAELIRGAEGMSWDGNTGIVPNGLAAGYRK